MNKEWLKPAFAALVTAAAAYFKILTMPVFVLILAMTADYWTGMIYAYISGTLSSKTGFKGIIKKLCYMFAVACGIIVDYICNSALDGKMNICFFGILVTVWLILNEVVSILENLDKIGVPLPSFLKKAAEHLKNHTEKTADESIDEKTEA
jgi:toxin secretion/phage lysis holin